MYPKLQTEVWGHQSAEDTPKFSSTTAVFLKKRILIVLIQTPNKFHVPVMIKYSGYQNNVNFVPLNLKCSKLSSFKENLLSQIGNQSKMSFPI
nr:ASN_HP1_G0028530.mRNA.1.CDS.1 [Saccharomyces cerevisiae]